MFKVICFFSRWFFRVSLPKYSLELNSALVLRLYLILFFFVCYLGLMLLCRTKAISILMVLIHSCTLSIINAMFSVFRVLFCTICVWLLLCVCWQWKQQQNECDVNQPHNRTEFQKGVSVLQNIKTQINHFCVRVYFNGVLLYRFVFFSLFFFRFLDRPVDEIIFYYSWKSKLVFIVMRYIFFKEFFK